MLTILLIVLIILLITSGSWGYSVGRIGPMPASLLGVVVIVLVVWLVFAVSEPVLPPPVVR
jgi:hypothetical protein